MLGIEAQRPGHDQAGRVGPKLDSDSTAVQFECADSHSLRVIADIQFAVTEQLYLCCSA